MPCHRVPVPADRPLMLIVMAIMLIPALTAGNHVGGHAGAAVATSEKARPSFHSRASYRPVS